MLLNDSLNYNVYLNALLSFKRFKIQVMVKSKSWIMYEIFTVFYCFNYDKVKIKSHKILPTE